MIADPRIIQVKCPLLRQSHGNTNPIFPSPKNGLDLSVPGAWEFLMRVSFKSNRDDSMRASRVIYPMDETHRTFYKKGSGKGGKTSEAPGLPPFKLYIDADGCPVVNLALKITARRHVESFLVCDTAHQFSRRARKPLW